MAHSYSYSNLLYHIGHATKERRPLIDDEFQTRLYDYVGGTIRGLKSTSLEIGGVEDHVHILAKLPPTIAVADFYEKLKAIHRNGRNLYDEDSAGRKAIRHSR
jgi:putative transposase